jgi:hypothetical protein
MTNHTILFGTKTLFWGVVNTTRNEVVGQSRHLRLILWVGPQSAPHASVVLDWTLGSDGGYSAHPTIEIANGHFLVITPVLSLLTAITGQFYGAESIEPEEVIDYVGSLGFIKHA